jgi:hypothetical protein
MYFKTFEWYRDMNGPQSLPESYAAAILGALHGLNVATVAVVFGLPLLNPALPGGMAAWLLGSMLIGMVPPMWCRFRVKEIEAEFGTDEEVINPKGRIWMAVYAVVSILGLVAAFAAREMGHGGHQSAG